MTVHVDPSDRLSTRVLRLLAVAPGPMTVDQMAVALNLTGVDRKRLTSVVMNFRTRGRIVQRGRLAGVSGRPGLWTITDAAREALARDTSKGWRPARTRYWNAWRVPKPDKRPRPRLFKLAPETVVGSVPRDNAMWRAAAAVVPRRIPPAERDDLIMDLVVAQLEGETDLLAALKRARRERDKALNSHRTISLDAVVRGTESLRLIDTLTMETERA